MKTIDFLRMTKEYEQPYGSYELINAAIDGLCVLAAPTETPVTLSCTPAMTAALRSGKDAPTACLGDNDREALCTPSELRLTDYGRKDPNARETWMDVQVRAHVQAWALIKSCMR